MAIIPIYKRLGQFIHRNERLEHWLSRILHPFEVITKKPTFDCRMCGQCVLHSTGMTCPMTCPKDLRNGPCGGVSQNGSCEVIPEMVCVWVKAYTPHPGSISSPDAIKSSADVPMNRVLH
jgi:hypothetical protein